MSLVHPLLSLPRFELQSWCINEYLLQSKDGSKLTERPVHFWDIGGCTTILLDERRRQRVRTVYSSRFDFRAAKLENGVTERRCWSLESYSFNTSDLNTSVPRILPTSNAFVAPSICILNSSAWRSFPRYLSFSSESSSYMLSSSSWARWTLL